MRISLQYLAAHLTLFVCCCTAVLICQYNYLANEMTSYAFPATLDGKDSLQRNSDVFVKDHYDLDRLQEVYITIAQIEPNHGILKKILANAVLGAGVGTLAGSHIAPYHYFSIDIGSKDGSIAISSWNPSGFLMGALCGFITDPYKWLRPKQCRVGISGAMMRGGFGIKLNVKLGNDDPQKLRDPIVHFNPML